MRRRAKDIMQRDFRAVPPSMRVADLQRSLLDAGKLGFAVVKGERLLGVVSTTDIIRKLVSGQTYGEYVCDYYRTPMLSRPDSLQETLASIGSLVGQELERATVADIMSHPPITVDAEAAVPEVARRLVEHSIHRVPVVDGGKLVGIVTSLDIARYVAETCAAPAAPS